MPQLEMNLPQVPDMEWQDAQFGFNGKWMPDIDPALIGAENFVKCENSRYKDKGLEGVSGYVNINATAITTFTKIRNGFQLQSPFTVKSYNMVHAINSSGQGRVYENRTAIGTQGNFVATQLHADAAVSLQGRFSAAPQGSAVYCNGQENKIYSGDEHRIAAAFQVLDHDSAAAIDVTDKINSSLSTTASKITLGTNLVTNGNMEADSNWTDIGGGGTMGRSSAQAKTGTYSWNINSAGTNDGIKSDTFTTVADSVYRVTCHVYPDDTTTVTISIAQGSDGAAFTYDQSHTGLIQDQWNEITFEYTEGSGVGGSNAYIQFDSGAEAGAKNWYIDDVTIMDHGVYPHLVLMTTRPVKAFEFYVASPNTAATALNCDVWTGSDWTAVSNIDDSDTEDPAGDALGQSGTLTFDYTGSTAALHHFEELFLYAYDLHFTDGSGASADIYQITCDMGFNDIQNVWDGVYRQPIQFQSWSADHFEDYTLQVNESSDLEVPVGGQLDGLLATDYVITMFEDKAAGMRWTMLGNLVNSAAATMTVQYWNGHDWTDCVGLIDGTNSTGATSLLQTGLIEWSPQSDEEMRTLFGTVGYAYKVKWSATLSGTKGSTGGTEILVDLVYGIPAPTTIEPFDFSVLYKNRVMLGSFSAGNQRNRMDFCAANAPDVWNGYDSSDDGRYSLYFGNEDKITAAVQLYNRFGSNLFSMLLVAKEGETYVMTGDTPDDFQVFPVSLNTGCPAPRTMATAEMGFEEGAGIQRQVAIWVSHAGPMMFDGAVMQPLGGVDLYFDPEETEAVNWTYVANNARGWVDHTFKEYNLLIPSTTGQEVNNVWLVYDLIRKKWFKKDTGSGQFPQSAWPATFTTGNQTTIAGFDNGKIAELEKGTSWGGTYADETAGSNIKQVIQTGEFFPTNNIWDMTLVRKFKIICQKYVITTSPSLSIDYYTNSAESASNVIFQDADASIGTNVTFLDMDVDADGTNETQWSSTAQGTLNLNAAVGTTRLIRLIQDRNDLGWIHSYEFTIETNDEPKGWNPIAWGIQYRVERKDNTATAGA